MTKKEKIVLDWYVRNKVPPHPPSKYIRQCKNNLRKFGLIVREGTGVYRIATPDEVVRHRLDNNTLCAIIKV